MAQLKFELILSKWEAGGVSSTLQKIYKTIEDPNTWNQGEYQSITADKGDIHTHKNTYCLIGAAREVDGQWEDLTHAFMVANLPKGFVKTIELDLEFSISIGDTLKEDTLVESFNDHNSTTHKKVLSWLRSLIAKADKIAKTPKKKKVGK